MSRMYLMQAIDPLHDAQGPAFNTFTAFQQILVSTTYPAPVIPAPMLNAPGAEFWLNAHGEFSNTATPTLGIGFRYGAATPATDLALPTAITTTTGATSWQWHAELYCRVRQAGSAGTLHVTGLWRMGTSLVLLGAANAIPNTLALRSVTFDTTVNQAFAPAAVWGTSNVSNTIRVDKFSIYVAT